MTSSATPSPPLLTMTEEDHCKEQLGEVGAGG
jgi:hypothetical protein